MTPEEREGWRQIQLQRLDEMEERLTGLAEAGGRGAGQALERLRKSRAALLGTGPPMKVRVFVPKGATAAQKQQAVIAAVAKRLDKDAEGDCDGTELD